MRKSASRELDALMLLAKASGGRRRRQSLIAWLVCTGIFLATLALFVWWVWPASAPPAVLLAVYDQIAIPGETTTLLAQLEPLDPEGQQHRLTGYRLAFEAVGRGALGTTTTAADGSGRLSLAVPTEGDITEILARYPGNPKLRQRGAEGRGRLYVWPADSALLLIDADELLPSLEQPQTFWRLNNLDIRPRSAACAVLQGLVRTQRIVYLSGTAQLASRHNKLRAWLHSVGVSGPNGLPDGPVLSAAGLGSGGPGREFCSRVVEVLRPRFPGKLSVVTANPEHARAFQERNIAVFFLGTAEAPVDVSMVPDWSALARHLNP